MTEAMENQNFDELADPRLQGNYDRGEMFRMIEAAAACVRHSAIKRPKMSQVKFKHAENILPSFTSSCNALTFSLSSINILTLTNFFN